MKNSYTTAKARALGFRSGFEVDVSECLKTLGLRYDYEDPVTCCFNYYKPINKGKLLDEGWKEVKIHSKHKVVQLCQYTVDFAVYSPGEDTPTFYLETKGRFTAADRNKHKLLKAQYPDTDLRILFQHNGKATPKMSYKQWCDRFEIKCGFIKPKRKNTPGLYFSQEWIDELRTVRN